MATITLPSNYQSALQALRAQAVAASDLLMGVPAPAGRLALRDAQRQMVRFERECRHIMAMVMAADRDLTVPTMTDDDLLQLLIENQGLPDENRGATVRAP